MTTPDVLELPTVEGAVVALTAEAVAVFGSQAGTARKLHTQPLQIHRYRNGQVVPRDASMLWALAHACNRRIWLINEHRRYLVESTTEASDILFMVGMRRHRYLDVLGSVCHLHPGLLSSYRTGRRRMSLPTMWQIARALDMRFVAVRTPASEPTG